jgi:hypothetical protein
MPIHRIHKPSSFKEHYKLINMRNKILEISKTDKKIIGIRLYGEDDDFWLGYIEDYNDKIIQLRYFDKLGLEDGLVIEQQDSIDSIDFDSEIAGFKIKHSIS